MAKCNIEFPSNRAEKSTVGRFFWKILIPGELSLGYKPNSTKLPGHWFARTYAGEKKYRTEKLALADDLHEPNGVSILSFKQAKERAEKDTAPVRSADDGA